MKRYKSETKPHWLDYAEIKHGAKLVNETKTVVNILVLYSPLPIFWALHMQQGSRWVFQAAKMDGDIGFYTIKPDQMIVLNSLFAMITLPFCDYFLYPLLEKVKIRTLLQKMTIGGMLGVIAFIVAGLVELKSEKNFISIFWMFPQYLIMSFSEVFLFVSNVSFAYTEAPASMKSVMTSFVFVFIAMGNIIVIIISGTKLFESQAIEFFFFAGVLFAFMILFGVLASRYKQANHEVVVKDEDNKDTDNKF